MVRRVVSLVRSAPAALRDEDPVLEANAYALAEAVDLTVVLAGPAVELALPAAAAGDAVSLRGLLESGVHVYVDAADLRSRGISASDLVDGVEPIEQDEFADVLVTAQAVLSW